jgi:hypothetical protein
MNLYNKDTLLFLGIFFLSYLAILAQKNETIEIGNLYPGEVEYSAFEILEKSTIKIQGKAGNFGGKFKENLVFYGWIINSKSRDIIWDAREDFDFENEQGMYDFDDQEPLEAGTYEVYYTCSDGHDIEINSFGDFISRIFPGSNDFKRKYRSKLGITVSGVEGKFREVDPTEVMKEIVRNSIVSINKVLDNENSEAGFSLIDNTEIRIYAIGEGSKENIIDLAWISEVKTNKIVWKSSLKKSFHAGGGRKNYLIDKKIKLPKGSYILHYSSDDSHSFETWNVMPPDDPQFWGATIWAASPKDKKNVIPFREEDIIKPMIELTRVGDDEYLSQGFTLQNSDELSILCLGEGYDKKNLSDYGWIVNADTKELIWTMKNNNKIEHAGGSYKNRMVEEILILAKGNYIAYYLSDDSHSYEEWNDSSPFDRVRWGLTIWSDKNDYRLFDGENYKSENILSEIVKVRDDEDSEESFKLSHDSKIRILAIGEGDRSGMDDYGWIEDSKGDVVWEMTHRNTKNAGGASKNRLFNRTISLEAGKYTLHYITDGSHSYNSWNSSPPANQDNYGITLLLYNK